MKRLLTVAMLGVWATGAMAHSPLDATLPANKASVTEVPSEVTLTFKGSIRLTRISMTYENHPSVDLDLEGFNGFLSEYAIPLKSMGAGHYMIEWRGLGTDGHASTGSFSFTVE